MSDLSDPLQARAWVGAWRAHCARRGAPDALARRLRRAADEQRANLGRARRAGYQGAKGRIAYEKSVALLESEATKAEVELVLWREEKAAREAEAEKRAEARRAELMRKYPRAPR